MAGVVLLAIVAAAAAFVIALWRSLLDQINQALPHIGRTTP